MKTLFLLRHGKSDWSADAADHERPLAPRGRDAAQRIGRFLAALGQTPDRIVSSSAVRARDTARLALEAGGWERTIELDRGLYGGNPESLLRWLREIDDATTSLMIVGHEPTWSLLAEGLIGGGNIRFPTAALARIELHVEHWRETDFGAGELIWLQLPRTLKKMRWPDRD